MKSRWKLVHYESWINCTTHNSTSPRINDKLWDESPHNNDSLPDYFFRQGINLFNIWNFNNGTQLSPENLVCSIILCSFTIKCINGIIVHSTNSLALNYCWTWNASTRLLNDILALRIAHLSLDNRPTGVVVVKYHAGHFTIAGCQVVGRVKKVEKK